MALPALMASSNPAIASFMKELLLLFSRSKLADVESGSGSTPASE
jgi:hypothetical protein